MDDLYTPFSELPYGRVVSIGIGDNPRHFGQADYAVRRRRPELFVLAST